jgi:hypothetical protein
MSNDWCGGTICNTSYFRGEGRRILNLRPAQEKCRRTLSERQIKTDGLGGGEDA